jgi:hypothetical protein
MRVYKFPKLALAEFSQASTLCDLPPHNLLPHNLLPHNLLPHNLPFYRQFLQPPILSSTLTTSHSIVNAYNMTSICI